MMQLLNILKTEAEERTLFSVQLILKLEKAFGQESSELVNKILRELHSLKGAARSVGLSKLETHIHGLEDRMKAFREPGKMPDKESVDFVLKGIDQIVPHISVMIETGTANEPDMGEAAAISSESSAASGTIITSSQIRMDISRLQSLSGLVGELFSIMSQDKSFYTDLIALKILINKLKDDNEKSMLGAMLDSLAENMRLANFNRELMYQELGAFIRELSLSQFNEYRTVFDRTVRDAADELGKSVAFTVYGAEEKIDKFLLEHVSDSIIHLLRNSVSHGIEMPSERVGKGKKEEGSVYIRLSKTGKNMVIEVGDDGRGIEVEKIKQALLKKGIVKQAELDEMPDNEIVSYIFMPGFSTSDRVSRLSGQGIGMDVVKEVVAGLGGSVEIGGETGTGLTVRMVLPMNLSTVHGILIYFNKHPYIIPVSFCQSIRRIKKEHIKDIGGRNSIITEYGVVPVFDLARLTGNNIFDSERTAFEIIMLKLNKDIAAFIVDTLGEKQEFIIKQLPPGVKSSIISGCAILSTGDLAYLINIQELFGKAMLSTLEFGSSQLRKRKDAVPPDTCAVIPPKADIRDKRILLVDDSLTSRTVEKNILVSYGFYVDVASDGLEGFEKLTSSHYDLVIADIEMPRMNGFELIDNIRKTPGLSNLPVFIVSTLDSDEDRKKGLEVGADAYIVKTGMGEETLVSMITRYLAG